jgi:hypothetical protein
MLELEALDGQAIERNHLDTKDRLDILIQSLADARQSRYGSDLDRVMERVLVVFEEVVWGVDHVSRRLRDMRRFAGGQTIPLMVRGKLREIEAEEPWLVGRLEVLDVLLREIQDR